MNVVNNTLGFFAAFVACVWPLAGQSQDRGQTMPSLEETVRAYVQCGRKNMRPAYRGEDPIPVARIALDFCGQEYVAIAGRYAIENVHGDAKTFVETERQKVIDLLVAPPASIAPPPIVDYLPLPQDENPG